jgi:O-antigen/teichoic acid export membrane protein
MVASLVVTGMFVALRYWFVKQQRFSDISRAMIAQGGGRALIPIVLGATGCGWIGLLAGEIAGRALGISRMLAIAWPRLVSLLRQWDMRTGIDVLRRNIKYPLIGLPSSLMDALAAALPLPLIANLYGTMAAGQYLLVQRIASLPAGLIVASVSDVYHPVMAQAYWEQPEQLRPIIARIAKRLLLVAGAIYIPLSLISPFLFSLVFGQQWGQAGIFMAILAPINIAALVVSPLSRALYVMNRIEKKLVFDAISLLVPIAGLYGLHSLGWGIYRSLVGFSLMHIGANIVFFLLIWQASGTAERR